MRHRAALGDQSETGGEGRTQQRLAAEVGPGSSEALPGLGGATLRDSQLPTPLGWKPRSRPLAFTAPQAEGGRRARVSYS